MFSQNQMIGDKNSVYSDLIKESMLRTHVCLPCVVQSFDQSQGTVECQPCIRERIINAEGELSFVQYPLLINVPVAFPSCNGHSVLFPINRGDEVLVIFSDLCIDNFWQNSGVQNPVELRRHDLSDGIAIPANLSLVNKQKDKSQTYIEFVNGDIKFCSTTEQDQITLSEIFKLRDFVYNHIHQGVHGPTSKGFVPGDSGSTT